MRYYVYTESLEPTVEPFIIAEVVRDLADDRALSLAASIAGPRSRVMTRRELMESIAGRKALESWDARDDAMFETETMLLMRSGRANDVRLHIVKDGDREPARRSPQLPTDPELRATLLKSLGLREMTRHAVQRARALRAELHESLKAAHEGGTQVG